MSVVNIRRDVDDQFYRYRMPLLQTKIEGRGNGIKTVVPNMSDIARALSRPPTYLTKFFGFEIGAQTTSDEKNDRYIVNGAHQADQLRTLLDSFIDKFVLCGNCKNPETELKLKKDGMILRDCKACGARSKVDMRHKLTTYITKNPPPKRSKAGNTADDGQADGPGSDDELTARINAEAADIPTAEQREKGKEEWSVDTSEEAVKARVKALEGSMAGSMTLGDDDDGDDADSPYDQFGLWLVANRKGGEAGTEVSAVDVYKKAQELGIEKKHKAVQVLMQGLFTDDAVNELKKYLPTVKKMTSSEKHQKSLLGGLEHLTGAQYPTLLPDGLNKILAGLYNMDVLEGDVIKAWATHVSKKYVDKDTSKKVRKAAQVFVKRLEEIEAESSSEEESSEEETKVPPPKKAAPAAKPAPATNGKTNGNGNGNGKATPPAQEEEDDESDLDNL